MDLDAALLKYLTQLRAAGRSERTQGQNRRHIALLASWLHGRGGSAAVGDLDHETLALSSIVMTASSRARTPLG